MEPLFLAVIFGCRAGLLREALHKVYIPRIQRGDAAFAAKALGARGPLLSVLAHFFGNIHWGSLVETGVEGQSLTAEDQLLILMQSGLYLTATRGMGTPEARICYERAESLCHLLDRPLLLYVSLMGQWRYSLNTAKLTATMQIAERVYSFAQQQNNPTLMMGACTALTLTRYFLGDFDSSRQYIMRALQIWRSGGVQSPVEEVDVMAVTCLCFEALSDWHLGKTVSSHAIVTEAISLAKELNDMHGLAVALNWAAVLRLCERDPSEVERLTSDLIELSTRQNFPHWLALGNVYRGWAHSVSGQTSEGLSWIEDGIGNYRATGSMLDMPFLLALKAEALYLADRTCEALEAITNVEALIEKFENRYWCAELNRLRGVFLTAMGADDTEIEASFCAAISTAREQKSISLEKRAEATYAEYRRQKASGSGGRGFRLPLW
jgi:hypothetical protein